MEKLDFNDVVRDNIDYVKSIVRKYAKNKSIIEELTQEIFLRAYKHYDQYIEQGKVKQWLAIVAENKLKNEYKTMKKYYNIDNYYDITEESFQNTLTAPESTNPEDIIISNEQTEKIMNIINLLPKKQRDVIIYRYVYDYSVKEIEQIMGITASNIKVTVHNALNTVREKAGININTNITQNKLKGEKAMKFDKLTAYSYLYEYAKGHISTGNKAAVEEYIQTDEEAANIAEALKILQTKIVMPKEDEQAYCHIIFQPKSNDKTLYYSFYNNLSDIFKIFSTDKVIVKMFVDEGKEPEFTREIEENGKIIDTVQMVDKLSLVYFAIIYQEKSEIFKKSNDAPDLYKISESLNFSVSKEYSKVMMYVALPEEATNIRVKRGNGVIDCGKYKFAYADRYIVQDESLALECTFNMK